MPDDSQLLQQFDQHRSEAAFAELVQRHINLVYSVARRRVGGDHHLATEVCQLVFLALARNARNLTRHPVLGAWLHVSTRNAAANLLRAERRRDHRLHQAEAMPDTIHPSPSPTDDWERVRPILDETLDQLGERERQAIILRFFENRTFAEIGASLSLQEDAARKQVGRTLEKLQELLARRGVTSTVAALSVTLAENAVASAPSGVASLVTGSALAGAAASGSWSLASLLKLTPLKIGATAAVVAGAPGFMVHEHFKTASAAEITAPPVSHPATPPPPAPAPTPAPATTSELIDRALAEGLEFDQGKTAKRDAARARGAYVRAAELGSAAAEFRLGYFYEVGDGVPQSYADARIHYQRAIDLGLPSAHLRLGILDLEGWGGPRAIDSAVRHITAAAESGDRASSRVLSGMYFAGIGVTKDLQAALHWEEQAAREDDPVAETNIGTLLGLLRRENLVLSKEWYQLSAEQNYTDGMLGMASTFLQPNATPDQVEQGRKWLQLAADQGNAAAAFHLAGLILLNPALANRPGSIDQARRLLEKSRDDGEHAPADVLELGATMPLAKAFAQVLTVPPEQRYVTRFAQTAAAQVDAAGNRGPVPTKVTQPIYPDSMRLTRTGGKAEVQFTIDTTGRVRNARVVSATHPGFGEAALQAVPNWRFLPAQKAGHVVEVNVRVPVNFDPSPIGLGASTLRVEIQSIENQVQLKNLSVRLRILSPLPVRARGLRTVVTAARDDTGLDLKLSETQDFFVTSVGMAALDIMRTTPVNDLSFRLGQPAETAKSLQVLDGSIELVVPENDPDATVTLPGIMGKLGTPLDSPTLAAAGITVVVYDYMTAMKFRDAKFGDGGPQDYDSGPVFGRWQGVSPFAKVPPEVVARMGKRWEMQPNQVAIGLADPKKLLVALEFRTKDGQPLLYNHLGSYHASGMQGKPERRCDIYELPTPLPADIELVCWIATKQATTVVPFHFEDVPLSKP